MSTKLLKAAYSPEDFRLRGHQLIDKLADHLNASLNGRSPKVINWSSPDDERNYWINFLENGEETTLFDEIIQKSIHIHHPKYLGHQISPAVPITALTSILGAQLNNGMGIYEMGAAGTAMERIVTDLICSQIGYTAKANGFLTSGGTLANLTALLSARKKVVKQNVWQEGYSGKLAIMVSEEAHYCIDRAARIMGLGDDGIVKIPVDKNFNIRVDLLENCYKKAAEKGLEIFAIVGSAPATATGIYDNLKALAKFASEKNIWLHVDGAHGGAAIFSKKYSKTVRGIQHADSVVIDGHKMMMMPGITTALLFKDGNNSHSTFSQKADYLLQESAEQDWYNLAKRTFECTKYMMSLHWYTLIKSYGFALFDEFVTTLYDSGEKFAGLIQKDPDFELAAKPMSNIVCFRFIGNIDSASEQNLRNKKIRQQILEEGEFYIVETKLRELHYLRVTIMNPFTTPEIMEKLLAKIKGLAKI
ncbi:pyridoxal phosphate-dependent decarboxylase family protein [Muriicola sp. Z0-33]|uniref:pyridoxal phosphate-dependent decarboxylase family protein n=1 Tax=Muriicola sp. Z0-33 TaxID=2816957 RepID=UPI0022376E5C|nr:aminotransferase class I/II-fold pyridoxal phosphate-dependent enzyme [Muriicola sp. Z0-33]MCW5517042.1 aminotransferase class I/II-fold pyridoxal phosphate-dependent enzyme [Muriicola sp. Z0-33]